MPTPTWNMHIDGLHQTLLALSCSGADGSPLDPEECFGAWRALTLATKENGSVVYLIGNGASASMASHFAADLAKNATLHTEVFSDLSLLTAVANDLGYERVFAEPLLRRARPNDMLVAISSSGCSPNILAAAETSSHLGMTLVTLTAMDPGNPLRHMGRLNFHIPAGEYGDAESCHAAILHHWMDIILV